MRRRGRLKIFIGARGPRPQDASDHQDYEPFLRGNPYNKPSFTTGILWGEHIQNIYLYLFTINLVKLARDLPGILGPQMVAEVGKEIPGYFRNI